MGIGSAIAIYFIIWWLCFFPMLTLGNREPDAADVRLAGAEPGAPANHGLRRKLIITTILSVIVFGAVYGVINSGLTLADIPLPAAPGT